MNKKAISAVVVTVLIVLVAIIAVAILWAALRPPIEEGAEGAGEAQECFTLNLQIDSASYNNNTQILTTRVLREAGAADLAEVKVVVDGVIGNESTNIPQELETKTYTVGNLATKPLKVEVAGLLVGDKTCSISDTAEGSEILLVS